MNICQRYFLNVLNNGVTRKVLKKTSQKRLQRANQDTCNQIG